jgi:hypothetical protein
LRTKSNTDSPFSSTAIASPSTMHERTGRAATASTMNGKTVAEVVPVSGDQPNGRALAVRQDAEAIVLDFMNPAGTARGHLRRPRQARLKTGLGLFSKQSALQLTRGGHRWGKNSRRTQTKGAFRGLILD